MLIERLWTNSPLRNFNYLLACPETGQALAIDPLDHVQCLAVAKARGWEITQIVNTHEHQDHIAGNPGLVAATGAKVIAHHQAVGKIPGIDRVVQAGDTIQLGRHIALECMHTPGHTQCHICLLAHTEKPALFSGDTLFNAGIGNVHKGGNLQALYHTVTQQLARLPGHTQLYPGHDLLETNVRFTLAQEPGNATAQALCACVQGWHDPVTAAVATLEEEKTYNLFLRLNSPSLIASLRARDADFPENPDAQTVFFKLRQLRDQWV